MIYTSLDEIKSFNPCSSGWRAILRGQGKTEADGVLFPLVDALNSNSVSDVCWLMGKRKKEIQVCVKFARLCADSVAEINSYWSRKAAAYADKAANAANAAYAYAATDAADAYSANAYAAYADAAAADAAYAYDAYAYDARSQQREKNKQFLIQCITEWGGE